MYTHTHTYNMCVVLSVYLVVQCFPTLCDPMDCAPDSFIHGIFQARILEWVAITFSRGSSQPRDWTLVSCITRRFFTVSAVAQLVRIRLQCRRTQVWSLGGEDALEKEMANHSNILVWKIPWTVEPGGLQSMGCKELGMIDWLACRPDSALSSIFDIHEVKFPSGRCSWQTQIDQKLLCELQEVLWVNPAFSWFSLPSALWCFP